MAGSQAVDVDKPRIEEGKALRIVGLSRVFTFDNMVEIPQLWQRFAPIIDTIPGQGGRVAYGVCFAAPEGVSGFGYLAGVELADAAEAPEGLTGLELPASHYAVFVHQGHVTKLSETIHAIMSVWLPASGRKHRNGPEAGLQFFERYDEDFDPRTGFGGIEVWMPIRA